MHPIVLASASPRRQELLRQIGIPFTVEIAPEAEVPWGGEQPEEYVLAQARAKADAVLARSPDTPVVLGADTVVVIDEDVLGKPRDAGEARAMLALLAGRAHRVITAFRAVRAGTPPQDRAVETWVSFRPLTTLEIDSYINTLEWEGKAGAYAIQGIAGAFVTGLRGSYPNVVGLPLTEVVAALLALGALPSFPLPVGR
jgi:septum formation protein